MSLSGTIRAGAAYVEAGLILAVCQCDCVKRDVFHIRQYHICLPCFKQNSPLLQFTQENINSRGGKSELVPMQDIGIFFENFLT